MKTLHVLTLAAACMLTLACKQPKPADNTAASKGDPSAAPAAKIDIQNNNVHIDYSDTGTGDTTLLLVHGWALNKGYFVKQVDHFSKKYRVVAIDLAGFGKSGRNRDKWDTKTYASDIDAVIDQLKLKNVVLVGHSMAGDIVLQAATDRPDKVIGLVGVDNFKGVGWVPTAKDKKSMEDAYAQMRKNFVPFASGYFKQELFSKTTRQSLKDSILNEVAHADPKVATDAMVQGDGFDEVAALKKYGKTLYMINSDYQPTGTKGLDANKLPYKLMLIHATGHFPMIEAPEEFNKDLEVVLGSLNKN